MSRSFVAMTNYHGVREMDALRKAIADGSLRAAAEERMIEFLAQARFEYDPAEVEETLP